MALTDAETDLLLASLHEREDEGLDWHLRRSLVEVISYLNTETGSKSKVDNRVKIIVSTGDRLTLFMSKDDGQRINGWAIGEIKTNYPDILNTPREIFGRIELIYWYGYNFGDDTENSQDTFDRNVRTVERGLIRIKAVAGCELKAIEPLDRYKTDQMAHLYQSALVYRLCNI